MAQVIDALGKQTVKKKKKIIPPLPPTIPEVVPKSTISANGVTDTSLNPEDSPIWKARVAKEEATKAQKLQDAIVKQSTPTVDTVQEVIPPVGKAQDTSKIDSLTQQSNTATQSLVAQLKQRIADDIASQQGVIAKAPQQFDPLRAQSEVSKAQQLRSALERSSVLGDRGGIGRSEALATQTEGDNRLNAINLQQQNVISDAEATIASLEREGRYEEARIKADQTNRLLEAISNEQIRQEGITREDTIRQENLALDATEQKKQDFIDTITRFAQDYTAQINTVTNDGDPTNDWQIPLLETAKQDKIQTQGLDPNTGLPLPVDNTPTLTSSSALDLWEQTGIANQAVANALGIPVGTQFTRQATGGGTGERESNITFTDSNVTSALNTYLGDAPKTVANVGNWLIQNINSDFMTEQRFERLKTSYGITDEDLEEISSRRFNPNPSIGQ